MQIENGCEKSKIISFAYPYTDTLTHFNPYIQCNNISHAQFVYIYYLALIWMTTTVNQLTK